MINRKGFTLVEGLVLIGIVGTLIALLIPAIHLGMTRGQKVTEANYIISIYRPDGVKYKDINIESYYEPKTELKQGSICIEYYKRYAGWKSIYAPHGWQIEFNIKREKE